MNDIFISYANQDRSVAQKLADAFEASGWSVWWDREIPFGKAFDQVIEEELNAARCVVVLWSHESVRSRWVKTEAAAAADRDRLMPVLIEDVTVPLEFKRIQTAMLQGWSGDREHPEFARLVDSIRRLLGQPPVARITPPVRQGSNLRATVWAAVAVALVMAAFLIGKTVFHANDAQLTSTRPDPSSATPQAPPPASATPPIPSSEAFAHAVKGAFAIKIGDRIEDGVPARGAGNIETPGAKDVYTFSATAGQRVYFRKLEHGKDMEQIAWVLMDPDGAEVFDSRLYTEPGVQLLRKAGIYTLTVGSDRVAATGVYRLQLYNVPSPHAFVVKVGDRIKENVPGPGAGTIESPGVRDVYTFTAAPGQRVYFRMFGHENGMEQIAWKLSDGEGAEVFDSRLYTEPGVQLLRKGGAYALSVGSDHVPATGTYHLQLFNVPAPDQFAIKIGDTIRENSPGRGAGTIESPGAKDVYTFTAAAGQKVYFRKLEHSAGMEQIGWRLTDADGTEVFDSRLYTEPGVQTLRKGGTYTLTIGSDRVPATGTYRLQLSDATSAG